MSSSDAPDDLQDPHRVSTMISDMRSAWIDLLSARCATDRLRMRYSTQEIARFGERTTLNKSIEAVNAMCDYFAELRKHLTSLS